MAFNTFVLDQLNNPPEDLAIEILKILNATSYALPCAEIFKLSKEAVTSRDISLEMSQTLKPKGLVDIDRKERREGVASDIAFWKITQAGKDFLQSKNAKLPADITPDYEPPVFLKNSTTDEAVTEIEKIIDSPKPASETQSADVSDNTDVVSESPDYSDKPKAYQILKYIEANPWKTNKEIQTALALKTSIDGYISPYLSHVLIDKIEIGEMAGTRIFKVLKPVDEFYHHRKVAEKKQPGAPKNETTPIPQQPKETTAKGAVDAQTPAAEPLRVAVPEFQENATQNHQDEVVHDHPASKVRFAITSDKHIILMGLTAEDIELTEGDSHTLIQFCGDIALAANVSSVLASKVIDLETLGS